MPSSSDTWPLANNFEQWISSTPSWRSWLQSRARAAPLACSTPVKDIEVAVEDALTEEPALSQSTEAATPSEIFTTEWFKIAPSPKGGYGCFALKTIKEGTRIFTEAPLVEATDAEFLEFKESLPGPVQKEFMSLASWEMLAENKVEAIWKNNRFKIGGSSAVFAKASRFNHACMPFSTCAYSFNLSTRKMQFTTVKEVVAGEELTISYCSDPTTLYDDYGFFCDCDGCPKYSDEAKERRIQQRKRDFDHHINSRW